MRMENQDAGGLSPGAAAVSSVAAIATPNLLARLASPQKPRTAFWYASLRKPRFTPPDAAVPIVWAGIEACLAFGAYRLLRQRPTVRRNHALSAWAVSTAMIGGWSLIFFGGKRLGISTAAAALMVGSGVYAYRATKPVDRTAAAAIVPYIVWTSFATLLTGTIWHLNRGR